MTDKAVALVEKNVVKSTKTDFVIGKDLVKQKVLEEEEYLSVSSYCASLSSLNLIL